MAEITGPDFAQGVSADAIAEGKPLLGHVGDDPVVLVRLANGCRAVGAVCSHYHGPLAKGLVVGDTIRCPWHHACFSLRNGEVLGAPGLNSLPTWSVEQREGKVYVRDKHVPVTRSARPLPKKATPPESVVIVGGGAAGEATASALRLHGFEGAVTILSGEGSLPPDRPNLSKDFLAGSAPVEWVPIRNEAYYRKHDIALLQNARVTELDTARKRIRIADGREFGYGALLLATGAEPVRLQMPGADLPHVHYLRTVADSEAIIRTVEAGAKRAVVIGASFIGLEVAASLRTRGVEVHIVAPEARPLERVLGPQLGDFVRGLHESKGVAFHLGQTVAKIEAAQCTLSGGEVLPADIVVIGVGVRPVTDLAEQAGLATDNGVIVNEYLGASAPGIYAAGDVARWPDRRSGAAIRVEHWAVAQRQGQAAARNMLGFREPFRDVPFFWSQHYDVAVNYVGHAQAWNKLELDGDPAKLDCTVNYLQHGKRLAQATIYRDLVSLETEAAMERE